MKKLKYWFTLWQLRNYPVSALIPSWYWNLSVYWSKKEQRIQAGLASLHTELGDLLVQDTDDLDWGEEE